MFPTEASSQLGALRLADAITAFWREKGVKVHCRIEREILPGNDSRVRSVFTVRSNLCLSPNRGAA
jgi:hypothetical protein